MHVQIFQVSVTVPEYSSYKQWLRYCAERLSLIFVPVVVLSKIRVSCCRFLSTHRENKIQIRINREFINN